MPLADVTLRTVLGEYWLLLSGILVVMAVVLFVVTRGLVRTGVRRQALQKTTEERDRARAFTQAVMDAIPDSLVVIDRDYSVVLANRASRGGDGQLDPVTAGLKCHEFCHDRKTPCEDASPPCPLDEVIATKAPVTIEYTHQDAQGRAILTEFLVSPIIDEQGEVVQIVESRRDITERRRTEAALREREGLLNALLDHSPTVIYIKDLAGRYILVNRQFESLHGRSRDEVLGRTDYELYPGAAEMLRANDRTVVDTRRPLEAEETVSVYGQDRVYLSVKFPVCDDTEAVTMVCGVSMEITERKRAEEELRHSEERYALAQRAANVGSWDWNVRTGELHWSEEIEPMFGFAQGEFGATHEAYLECVHPEDRQRVADTVRASLAEGEQSVIEHRIVWPDETIHSVASRGSVFRGEDGTAVRMVGVVQDITERTKVLQELEMHRENLAQLVEERTADLAIAKERAEESDRLKSAFLAAMSHELRTPLNSIIGFTGMLLQQFDGPLNEEQAKQLGMVEESSRHLLNLINDILDLSKIEAETVELHIEAFSVREIVERTVQAHSPLARKKGLLLEADVEADVEQISSDKRRVEQILINLTSNAIKFTEQGSVRITCCIRGDCLVTRVQDTGIGIKQEDMGHLFETFRQLDSGLARKAEGTGLGLSICKKLAGMLGGEIQVESEWNVGSTFTVTLPLASPGNTS